MKRRWLAGLLCSILLLTTLPMVSVGAATDDASDILSGMTKMQEYIFECKSQEQILRTAGGSFAESSTITESGVFAIKTGEDGLQLFAGTTPTEYTPTLFVSSLKDKEGLMLRFRLDSNDADISFVLDHPASNQKISLITENRTISGSNTTLTAGTYYDCLILFSEGMLSYYYKEATDDEFQLVKTGEFDTAGSSDMCKISSLPGGGSTATGVTLFSISKWKNTSVSEAEILNGAVLKQDIHFPDYYTTQAPSTTDSGDIGTVAWSRQALSAAKGGSGNFTTGGGPYTSDIDPQTMTFVAQDSGSRTPAIGYSENGMVLSAGSKKTYSNTATPEGVVVGAYTWNQADMGNTTMDSSLGETGAIKFTFRLENTTSQGKIILEDGTNGGAAPNIAFSQDGFKVQGYDFRYGEEDYGTGWNENQSWSNVYEDFPLTAGTWYDVIVKNNLNRYTLYAKKSSAEKYKKIVSFGNGHRDNNAEKKLVLQAVLGTNTQVVSGDTWYMTVSSFTIKDLSRYADAPVRNYLTEAFDQLSASNYQTTGTATIESGALKLSTGSSFIANDVTLERGGYLEFDATVSSGATLYIWDGASRTTISWNTAMDAMAADTLMNYRVSRNPGQGISVYVKKATENIWWPLPAEVGVVADTTEAKLQLTNAGQDVADVLVVDQLQINALVDDSPVTVLDGMTGTRVVENNDTLRMGGNIRVYAKQGITKQQGMIVGYGQKDELIEIELFDIPAGSGEISVASTKMADSNIKTVKVFVWDGFENMIPSVPVREMTK